MAFETVYTMDTSSIKFGPGVTKEVGFDMRQYGARRVLVLTDPGLAASQPVEVALGALRAEGIDTVLYDQVRVEPTDGSFKHAIAFASEGEFEGYVAVGGGSVIDTAKAANLYATYPADFLSFVNPPIG
jgi:hydroxyacid-oxoacid transhydrogenase